MSLAQLKQEVAALTDQERKSLMAFLASLQVANDTVLRSELTTILDDKDPSNWVSLEDLQQRWRD